MDDNIPRFPLDTPEHGPFKSCHDSKWQSASWLCGQRYPKGIWGCHLTNATLNVFSSFILRRK